MGLLCAGFRLCPHGNQGTERSEDSLRIHGKSCVRDVTLEDGVGVMLCKGSPGETEVWSTSPLKSSSALVVWPEDGCFRPEKAGEEGGCQRRAAGRGGMG